MAEIDRSAPISSSPALSGQELAPRRFLAALLPRRKPVAVASSGLIPQPLWMIQGRSESSCKTTQICIQLSPRIYPQTDAQCKRTFHHNHTAAHPRHAAADCYIKVTAMPSPNLHLRVVDPAEFGAAAAALVAEALRSKPDAVLGLPTGNTPVPVYEHLVAQQRRGAVNFSRARVAMLDEYLGAGDRPISFFHWLREHFLGPAGIAADRVLRMPSQPEGIAAACAAYEAQLAAWGGCDLQLLGLGLTGHIGFNEPGSPPDSHTRVVPLSPVTREANEEYWPGEEVPAFGVTTGIATLLQARRLVLLVNGERKAEILHRTLEGPIGPEVPASFLRHGQDVWIVADRPAASHLDAGVEQLGWQAAR